MMALTLHEAMPGHHLQIAIAQELGDLPQFRRHAFFTAYVEGWGLYAESLGEDMGMYKTTRIRSSASSPTRCGGPCGWSSTPAFTPWNGSASGRSNISWTTPRRPSTTSSTKSIGTSPCPGQALAYKMGELKIKELRRKAESALGDKFDLRDFNDVVLQSGALPLDILEQRVNEWLKERP